jgi:TnpA family transposase
MSKVYSKEQIASLAGFSAHDLDAITRNRREHNRLGFAYQLAFVKLKGTFPPQQEIEIIPDLLLFVSNQVQIVPQELHHYAKRRPTVTEHQEKIRVHLGLKRFQEIERADLEAYLLKESWHLEQPAALSEKAEQWLREHAILRPSVDTLRRLIGEQRDKARKQVFERVLSQLSEQHRVQLESLLVVEENELSPFQKLKEPAGQTSITSTNRLVERLRKLESTGILELDLSWLNNNFQKALARKAHQYNVYRLRELMPAHRYTLLVCFLWQVYQETLAQLGDTLDKLLTRYYKAAQRELDEELKAQRLAIRSVMSLFCDLSEAILNDTISDQELRTTCFSIVPQEALAQKKAEVQDWLTGGKDEVFMKVTTKYNSFRKFAPQLLEKLPLEAPVEGSKILDAVRILRELNSEKKRKVPSDAPLDFIPKKLQHLVKPGTEIDRQAYEVAVITAVRDEIKRGNLYIPKSKRFESLDNFFIPKSEWTSMRDEFFRRARLPADPQETRAYLEKRLNAAYERFLASLDENEHISWDENGWRFGQDTADEWEPEREKQLSKLNSWIAGHMRTIKLPNLLIEVDNQLHFSRHCLPSAGLKNVVHEICVVMATVMAYGCNIGPWTMAQLSNGITYSEINRITDWYLNEDTLKRALADVVNAIRALDTTRVWGQGKTSSSDGQRFMFPRKVLPRTYSTRFGDYALEFYTFVADNYAPFYSLPIECTARDAAFVLDGLLYHESELDIEEHYVDTHGYTEVNFAAFAMYGRRFCPRIKGLEKQRIYKIDDQLDYGKLIPLLAKPGLKLHLDWICEHWDRMAHFYASLERGHTTASLALQRLVAFGNKNAFYMANRELGRIFKTEFILEYLSDPGLRRRTRSGLLKGEQLHALARHVSYGKQGKISGRDFHAHLNQANCLTLILACIVYWQAREITRLLEDNPKELEDTDLSLLGYISPIGWDNVTLYGDYIFDQELIVPPGSILQT